MRQLRRKSVVAMLALAVSTGAMTTGCSRAQARVAVAPTPLEVPPPPPRLVDPVIMAQAPEIEPVDLDVIPTSPPEPLPRPEPTRTDASRPDATPPSEVPASPAPTAPATTLQTLPTEREVQVQRSVRANLDGALANLNRVEYQRLGADARANYDQARRFIAQAEDALGSRNLVFAATVADKAATLAAQLAGR